MRRILFGGIGLSLGLIANFASAQDARPAQPPVRAARLGAPSAVPDVAPVSRGATPDEAVAQVGLRSRLWGTPVQAAPAPGTQTGTPTPGSIIYGAPIPGTTTGVQTPGGIIYSAPIPGAIVSGDQPMPPMDGASIPVSRPVPGGVPSIIEMRNADGTPANPPAGSILVPSVNPGGTYVCPPGLESPLFCDPMPGTAALGRVRCCNQWYTAGEYLMWWTRGTTLPPLITTSAPQFSGIPGLGNTTTVLGNGSFGDTFHSGGRLTLGRWFGDGQCRGIEGRLFFIDQSNSSFTTSTNQYPVLARPFFNVNDPAGPFSEVVGDPARGVGGVTVNMQHSLWGAEVNYRRFLLGNACADRRTHRLPLHRHERPVVDHRELRQQRQRGDDGGRRSGRGGDGE